MSKATWIRYLEGMAKNILGDDLLPCSTDPVTGYYRSGSCETGETDSGVHVVCAVMTEEFLLFSRGRGNDLSTPRPEYDFPGLKPGDRWCLCAMRWEEARVAGVAPPVVLDATHMGSLEFCDEDHLRAHALNE
jgi:uncharacterized protein